MTIQHYRNFLCIPIPHLSRNAYLPERMLRTKLYSALALCIFYHQLQDDKLSLEQPPEFQDIFTYIPEQDQALLKRELEQVKQQYSRNPQPKLLDFLHLQVQPILDEQHAYMLAALYSYNQHLHSAQQQLATEHNYLHTYSHNLHQEAERKPLENFQRQLAKHCTRQELHWFNQKFNDALRECQLLRTHYDSDLSKEYKYQLVKTISAGFVLIMCLLGLQFGLYHALYQSENAPFRKPDTILIKPLPEQESYHAP